MKTLASLLLAILLGSMFAACSQEPSKSVEEMIEPGDKIGDFLITTGEKEGVTYFTFVHCPLEGDTETCTVPVGTKVNLSNAIYDSDPKDNKNLDELWSEFTYEMTIEDRPVNLPAFGSIDVKHPIAGTLRHWNVAVISDQTGQITARFKGTLEGETVEGAFVVIYTNP